MNFNSPEVQWWQATSQAKEEINKHMYFIFCWAKYSALAIFETRILY